MRIILDTIPFLVNSADNALLSVLVNLANNPLLTVVLSLEEIKVVIFVMDTSNAPAWDGFMGKFLQFS